MLVEKIETYKLEGYQFFALKPDMGNTHYLAIAEDGERALFFWEYCDVEVFFEDGDIDNEGVYSIVPVKTEYGIIEVEILTIGSFTFTLNPVEYRE